MAQDKHISAAAPYNRKPRRECSVPKDDAIPDSIEEIIGVWVHGDDMLAVRIIFQGFVYPVDKGILFFLCGQMIIGKVKV